MHAIETLFVEGVSLLLGYYPNLDIKNLSQRTAYQIGQSLAESVSKQLIMQMIENYALEQDIVQFFSSNRPLSKKRHCIRSQKSFFYLSEPCHEILFTPSSLLQRVHEDQKEDLLQEDTEASAQLSIDWDRSPEIDHFFNQTSLQDMQTPIVLSHKRLYDQAEPSHSTQNTQKRKKRVKK